jgi:parallel beta-helix repeat protein
LNNNVSSNNYGIYIESDNILVKKNHITSNKKYGIYLYGSRKNTIVENNLINNSVNAYFHGYIVWITMDLLISLQLCSPNTWMENYWDDWDGNGSKMIHGKFSLLIERDWWSPDFELDLLSWSQSDEHPACEPYDIP